MPDLTTADFAFLRHLQVAESCTVSSLYSAFGEDRADYEISRLLSFHLIEAADYVSNVSLNHASAYRLTLAAVDLLNDTALMAKYRHRQRAEQKRNEYRKERLQADSERKSARRSWVQWTITTVLTILSFFSGAIVEKLTGFVERVLVFFHH